MISKALATKLQKTFEECIVQVYSRGGYTPEQAQDCVLEVVNEFKPPVTVHSVKELIGTLQLVFLDKTPHQVVKELLK